MSRDLLLLDLRCPSCGATLTEGDRVLLDGRVRRTGEDGAYTLSAAFGERDARSDLALEADDVVDLSCPKCEASLMLPLPCRLCGASLASLNAARGGGLEVCSRPACRAHALGGSGRIDDLMTLMHRMFDTPYD